MIIVGERVNATRKSIKKAVGERNEELIGREIERQDKAGADYIDLNVGTGIGGREREKESMKWMIDLAMEKTEKRFAIDSADPDVIRTAAEKLLDSRSWLLNSIKGEEKTMRELLPLAAEYKAPFIGMAMDAEGIPETADRRVEICTAIYEAARNEGIPADDIFFDPLLIPVSTDVKNGMTTLDTIRMLNRKFPGTNTIMGLSNISHGLPIRLRINQAYLIAAITHGLNAVICDPTRKPIRQAVLLGEVIAGRDRFCRKFSRAMRKGEFED